MKKRVIVLGGGVAGLSAAHELLERGFEVDVYEKRSIPGGKARSVDAIPGTNGRKALPGEHGFRFFPGFYKHLPDTMKRIPYGDNRHGVYGNLVDTSRDLIGRPNTRPLVLLPRFPRSFDDLKVLMETPAQLAALNIPKDDVEFFIARLWQLLTSCEERRIDEYERIPWWEFVEADRRSAVYRDVLAIGATRTLVAARAELASTKTMGDIGLQLMFNMVSPGESSDRVLIGPTNEVFIQPWVDHIRQLGGQIHFDHGLETIQCDGKVVTGVTVHNRGKPLTVTGDYYIFALPVEVMAHHVTADLIKADNRFEYIRPLSKNVAWMNGVQFYLKEDVPIVHGHEMFLDSPWSLTAISQAQFWPDINLAERGDGTCRGILSVDVSDWQTAGTLTTKKAARDCTAEEIGKEVWAQMKEQLNVAGATVLRDEVLSTWFIDPDIQNKDHNPSKHVNAEPLLVNLVNTWPLRPDAYTRLPNMYLASDYVRTHTDLATMEGANEAARRAVNAIIEDSGSSAEYCEIWDLHEPDLLGVFRAYDKHRFSMGLPWASPVSRAGAFLRSLGARIRNML